MKFRNRLIALLCILAFAGLGVLYFKTWVVRKPFAVILFLADSMEPAQLTAARLYAGGAEGKLEIDRFPHLALVSNPSADSSVPDPAAAASAIATGVRVPNRALSVSADGRPVKTLLELAAEKGRATGLVTNGRLGDPGIAAFYAHTEKSTERERLVAQLAEDPRITILLGGGSDDFLPESKEGGRKDGRDLLLEMRQKGYDIVRSIPDLENTPAWKFPRVLGLFGRGALPWSSPSGANPSLSDLVRSAITLLQINRKGYVLVVDAGLVRDACEANRGESALLETLEFDRALRTARQYAGDQALIIATGRVTTGGITVNGFHPRKDDGAALLGKNPSGLPNITWATGPNGPAPAPNPTPANATSNATTEASAPSALAPAPPSSPATLEPAAAYSQAASETASDMIAVGFGQGAEVLQGFINNTRLFQILSDQI